MNQPETMPYAPKVRRVIDWITWLRRACVVAIAVCILEPVIVEIIDGHGTGLSFRSDHFQGSVVVGVIAAAALGLTFLRANRRG